MKTDFSQMLSALRRERGISQKKAAKDLEISQALLSHYENGVREPKFEFVHKACIYYGVSADYILGRQGTDSITVVCDSPYTMDMVNSLADMIDVIQTFDDRIQSAAAEYIKSVFAGVKAAAEDPNHPARPDEFAKQQMLLADMYASLRENKE